MKILFEIMAKHPGDSSQRIYYDVGTRRFVNVTDRCNLNCTFCPNTSRDRYGLENYRLPQEPSLTRIIDTVCATGNCKEVVFTGSGEPTFRLYDILKAARYLKKKGVRVVLNTNGLADRIHNRMVAPDLEDNIDEINVLLNGYDAASYEKNCRPRIANAFPSVLDFIDHVREYVPNVNIVAVSELAESELAPIRLLASQIGTGFRKAPIREVC